MSELEQRTLVGNGMEGIVLRYGWFYGPGTNYDPADTIPRAIRNGRMPIVGTGADIYSFIHAQDAATATMKALAREKLGDMMVYIYNEQSGTSNQKAKTALAWAPRPLPWRLGFNTLYEQT